MLDEIYCRFQHKNLNISHDTLKMIEFGFYRIHRVIYGNSPASGDNIWEYDKNFV